MTGKDTVGFIGLGDIGAPMAHRILESGLALVVWNRTESKMAPLKSAGAATAGSPAELAESCEIICICVDSAAAMDDVLFGNSGITRATRSKVELVIDHSTLAPGDAKKLASQLVEHNIGFLDVPVSGGAVGARAGTLAAMAGGDAKLLDRARPIIASFANQITHMGPIGAGQAAKACNQIINFGNMAALAEAMALAQRFDIAKERIPEAIAGGFADSNIAREYKRSFDADDFSPVRYLVEGLRKFYSAQIDTDYRGQLGILMKDLSIALDMGRSTGVPLPTVTQFDSVFRMLQNIPEQTSITSTP
ncbi:NAD(P)-dependent oxidoreductase [Hyphomonas chukchiensis]|uniref:2-hydroxy-3-oxopropionate reductase n=1 Tax=Hyphomonas chukchiensis TaxID=1280947 RepID=A0A062UJQ2_9PROT|nr:NAD(P)-dependent oxidoreductase [Hyphomonas chukchiensis]KCZ58404.1 hypothetical protein HY30_16170 [Hyphomonas chukchiensis]|tara:strand:+ start:47517 stop:48434 length:918 start_codon:yes stop_codon:yes gene_type:complete